MILSTFGMITSVNAFNEEELENFNALQISLIESVNYTIENVPLTPEEIEMLLAIRDQRLLELCDTYTPEPLITITPNLFVPFSLGQGEVMINGSISINHNANHDWVTTVSLYDIVSGDLVENIPINADNTFTVLLSYHSQNSGDYSIIVRRQSHVAVRADIFLRELTNAKSLNLDAFLVIGDVNGDGIIDSDDLDIIRAVLGTSRGGSLWDERADLTNTGTITPDDLGAAGGNFGASTARTKQRMYIYNEVVSATQPVPTFDDIYVRVDRITPLLGPIGPTFGALPLPELADITLSNGDVISLHVRWNSSTYSNREIGITQTITGQLSGSICGEYSDRFVGVHGGGLRGVNPQSFADIELRINVIILPLVYFDSIVINHFNVTVPQGICIETLILEHLDPIVVNVRTTCGEVFPMNTNWWDYWCCCFWYPVFWSDKQFTGRFTLPVYIANPGGPTTFTVTASVTIGPDTSDMTLPRYGHTATLVGNRIIVIGGRDNNNVFNNVQAIDSQENIRHLGYISTPRYGHSATLVGNRIIIFGGRDGNGNPIETIEVVEV